MKKKLLTVLGVILVLAITLAAGLTGCGTEDTTDTTEPGFGTTTPTTTITMPELTIPEDDTGTSP